MALAIFDLDDTLIDGDSATLWLHWLVRNQLAPAALLAQEAEMMQAYHRGELHMQDYMAATLMPLVGRPVQEVDEWASRFIESEILPRRYESARQCVQSYQEQGWTVLIISATGEHLVTPIARRFGVEHSLAIGLDTRDSCYTGQTRGILTFREGKVERLSAWLQTHGHDLQDSHGYSDSVNDIPLLSAVKHAFAVNPSPLLREHAQNAGWTCLYWHGTAAGAPTRNLG